MDFPIHVRTKSAQETEKIGAALGASYLEKVIDTIPHVIMCVGDLGSGKTTFVRGLARGMGVTTRLLSPTFIIVRRYRTPKVSPDSFLYHLDLYRTLGPSDAEGVGIAEMLADESSVTVIEWPDRLGSMNIEHPVLVVTLKTLADDQHDCTIEMKSWYENAH
ncbi:MAG: tRNA (adenosine(37)-N6)-threonylcarbamoyltransferase complex ATPase subunit type 1 TsaE [Patescibacteria group bacterium]